MNNNYFAVINTGSSAYGLMHDAAKPYAVVEMHEARLRGSIITQCLSRHATYRGAAISRGRAKLKLKKEG